MKIIQQSVRLISYTPNPEVLIETMGRICYQSSHKTKPCEHCKNTSDQMVCPFCQGTGRDPETARAFCAMILKNGHESVLEHASASFMIVTDRGITHELVRHRIASFSQESTRYCNYSKDSFGGEISVIAPPGFMVTKEAPEPNPSFGDWCLAMNRAEETYFNLLERGTRPEIARSVLPTCLKSEIGMTANFREWRHFLKLRLSPKAHPQIREIAGMIQDKLRVIAPTIFGAE